MSTRIQFALNQKIVDQLYEIADLLEQQDANPFRVNAFRRAADTVKTLNKDIQGLVEHGGADELVALPNIGTGIARIIYEVSAKS
jgi:putative hydrolase